MQTFGEVQEKSAVSTIAVIDGPRVHWSIATATVSTSEGQNARVQAAW